MSQSHGAGLTALEGPLFWTHLWSDVLIGASYVVISVSLAYFVHRARRDIPFSVVFIAFGLFIITCGVTHFMSVWTLWEPERRLSAGVNVVTAAASVATAAAMPFTIPQALSTIRAAKQAREHAIAAARTAGLEAQNQLLQQQAVELDLQREEAIALAGRVEEANERLRVALTAADEARLEAEAASRAKSLFLGTMSHELRTPLNAIIGYEDLLEMGLGGPVTSRQLQYLIKIRHSASHLLDIIDQILNMTRIETHQESVRPEAVEVAEVVSQTLEMMKPAAVSKNLTVRAEIGETGLSLHTDIVKLRQILLNLMSNAVEFTNTGEVVLSVARRAGHVEFAVRDSGIGIAPEDVPQLFKVFWQADQSTTRVYGGTGLGLAATKRLVELLGGEIEVQSQPAVGSSSIVTLPFSLVSKEASSLPDGPALIDLSIDSR